MNTQMKRAGRLIAICLLASLSICSTRSYAAYNLISPGSGYETSPAAPNNQPDWMNNAVFTNTNGTVYAEVWDETGGNGLYLEIHDNAGNAIAPYIHLAQPLVNVYGLDCTHPDVILGGDASNNYVAVAYSGDDGTNKDVYLEVYTIHDVGLSTIYVSACAQYIFKVGNSGAVGDAHIDIANELYGVNAVKADVFVIGWEDAIPACAVSLGAIGARACVESLSHLAGCNTANFTFAPACLNNTVGLNASRGNQVDITIHQDFQGGYRADFVFVDNNVNYISIGRWDIGTSLTRGIHTINSGNTMEFPRIDAYDAPNAATTVNFDIVYREDNGTWQVQEYNPYTAASNMVTSYYTPAGTNNYNNSKPVVTAGTEDLSNTAYQFYSLAYQNTDLDEVFVQNININNGTLYGTPDYRIANNYTDVLDPVAISNDYIYNGTYSLMQPNEIYVCWYNNTSGTIDCKARSSAPPVMKPGHSNPEEQTCNYNISTVNKKNAGHMKVQPIPAADKITVDCNGREARSYSINDLTGRVLLQGKMNSLVQDIDLSPLAAGMYLLNVSYTDSKDVDGMRIVKQ